MKLPNGYGSVIKLAGKRRKPYAVVISVYEKTDSEKPKRKRKYLDYFENKTQALSYLAEYNNGNVVKEHQQYALPLTFAELYEKWKAYRHTLKNNPTDKTWKNYNEAFNRFSSLHEKRIRSIRMQDLQDVINMHSSKSDTSLGNMIAILHGMWDYAMMNDFTDKDVTTHLQKNSTYSGEPIHTRFTNSEVQALWNALGTINNVDIILIYIYTGVRPSELLEIKREDVHLDERYMIGGMKTDAGRNRIIPIHEAIVPLIQYRLNQNRPFLITNKYGNQYTYAVYAASNWKICMERMNMIHAPHDCRYTFAALADSDDVKMNPIIKKIIMGHSIGNKAGTAFKTGEKQDVTRGVYTEKTIEELVKAVNLLPTNFEDNL